VVIRCSNDESKRNYQRNPKPQRRHRLVHFLQGVLDNAVATADDTDTNALLHDQRSLAYHVVLEQLHEEADFLGRPLSHKAHELLHTRYTARPLYKR